MKPFELPVTRNPLVTREDFRTSLLDLLAPLEHRYSMGNAGLHLGNSGTHYPPGVALMEGWSRVLWGIAPLLAGGGSWNGLERHREGLLRGTDPRDSAWWGEPTDFDQRLVEMAAIALSLMIAREAFWEPMDMACRERVYAWLSTIERRKLPGNNWHFFRILVCTAFRSLGLPVDGEAERESFDLVESLYRGDGWYVDGPGSSYDLYNPFGFHFYGLVYARMAGERDQERSGRYIERARLFAPQFLAWFRENGEIVPYGRSLTYRFAAVSFFSACAFAGVEAVPWPVMKGVVLRHFRSWFSKPIFNPDGTLSVGYGYPDLVMAEQYNAPGSPYWALKAYLPLALGRDHPFWAAEEAPLPALPESTHLPVPHYVVSRSAEDVQILTPGRYPTWEAVHSAAKYCKFVYSARFGFCVSHASYGLEKTGCDSMLVLSEFDGYWRERRTSFSQESGPDWTRGRWKPWDDVEIETTLHARGAWHVRIHRIRSGRRLEAVEGGFSIPRFKNLGLSAELIVVTGDGRAAVTAPPACSRILDYPAPSRGNGPGAAFRVGDVVYPEPNLNILEPAVVLPVLRGIIEPGLTLWVCAVRAGDAGSTLTALPPRVLFAPDGSVLIEQGTAATDGTGVYP